MSLLRPGVFKQPKPNIAYKQTNATKNTASFPKEVIKRYPFVSITLYPHISCLFNTVLMLSTQHTKHTNHISYCIFLSSQVQIYVNHAKTIPLLYYNFPKPIEMRVLRISNCPSSLCPVVQLHFIKRKNLSSSSR